MAKDYPNDNPKAAIGAQKAPLHLVPPALEIGAAEGLADGAVKYDPYNWRKSDIAASVYFGPIKRHLFAWWDREDNARDSGVHHLKHIAANLAVVLDAIAVGTFVDDRPLPGPASKLLEEAANGIREQDSAQAVYQQSINIQFDPKEAGLIGAIHFDPEEEDNEEKCCGLNGTEAECHDCPKPLQEW